MRRELILSQPNEEFVRDIPLGGEPQTRWPEVHSTKWDDDGEVDQRLDNLARDFPRRDSGNANELVG
jgi:hypothetical protein